MFSTVPICRLVPTENGFTWSSKGDQVVMDLWPAKVSVRTTNGFVSETLQRYALDWFELEQRGIQVQVIGATLDKTVPTPVRQILRQLRGDEWTMLWLASRSEAFEALLVANTALAYALTVVPEIDVDYLDEVQYLARVEALAALPHTELATKIGFTQSKIDAVDLLSKIDAAALDPDRMRLLMTFWGEIGLCPTRRELLRELPRIEVSLFDLLGSNPAIVAKCSSEFWDEVVSTTVGSASIEVIASMLRDVFVRGVESNEVIPKIDSIQELHRWHNLRKIIF